MQMRVELLRLIKEFFVPRYCYLFKGQPQLSSSIVENKNENENEINLVYRPR